MNESNNRTNIGDLFGWLHCPVWPMLILAAILLGLAPFWPEPHLVQKAKMMLHGEHLKPIDWFDIVWHGWPLLWIALRLVTPNTGACRIPESGK